MKKFITLKEVKAITPNLRYGQQIGGLDEDNFIKEFGAIELRLDFKKEKSKTNRWFYFYNAEILYDGEKVWGSDFGLFEVSAMVEELNKILDFALNSNFRKFIRCIK